MRRQQLALLREELTRGLVPATKLALNSFWRDGRNVRFTPLGVEAIPGWVSFLTKPASNPVRGMAQQRRTDLSQRLFWGDQGSIYMWDTVNVSTVGTGYTGSVNATVTQPATVWSFVVWGDWVLATNGVDKPQIYQGTSFAAMDTLTTMPFTSAEIFVKRDVYVIAVNTSNGYNVVEWSDTGDPLTWQPTASNNAGNLVLRDIDGPLLAAVPLGDRIGLYTREQLILLNYIGSPYIFGYTPALNGIGAVSKYSVVPVGRRHFGMSRQGFFVTDGVQFEWIDFPQLRDYMAARVNWDQASKICGYHAEALNAVVWYYPSTAGSGEPDEGVMYDYKLGVWSLLDFGRTSALERDVFKWPVAATATGELYFHESGTSADGAPLNAWVESAFVSLGDPDMPAYVQGLRAEGDMANASLYVRAWKDLDAAGPVATRALSGPDAMRYAWVRQTAPFFTFKVDGPAPWRLEALELYGNRRVLA